MTCCDVNLARYDGSTGTATDILQAHFRRIAESAGATWGPEQDEDIDTLVAALRQAMRQEAWGVVRREVFGEGAA
jgi:hypothetical protein